MAEAERPKVPGEGSRIKKIVTIGPPHHDQGSDLADCGARLWHDEKLTDCQLISKEGIAIRVHKIVLIQSPFLGRILLKNACCQGNCDHHQESVVMFPDVEYKQLMKVVLFLYMGVLQGSKEGEKEERKQFGEIIKMLGMSNIRISRSMEGHFNCPNCESYHHKNEMLKHLIDVHVTEPYHKDLEAYEEKKDTHGTLSCTECANRGVKQMYYVQYNNNSREELIKHYKEAHLYQYCEFVERNCGVPVPDREQIATNVLQSGSREEYWSPVLETNPVKSPGIISRPRPREDESDDSDAESKWSGGFSDKEEEQNGEKCEKCHNVFRDNAEWREHCWNQNCKICGCKVHLCQKESHEKKCESEVNAKKKIRKRRKSNLLKTVSSLPNKTISPLPELSSESDSDDDAVKPSKPAKRKRLDSDDEESQVTKTKKTRRPSNKSSCEMDAENVLKIKIKTKSSKVVVNGDNSDSDTEMTNNQSGPGEKLKCRMCPKMVSSQQFRKHVVTHNYKWWDQDLGKEKRKCPIQGCNSRLTKKGQDWRDWQTLVIHLATYHKQLEDKMKQHNKKLEDFQMSSGASDSIHNNIKYKKPEEYDENGFLTVEGLGLGSTDPNLDDIPASSSSDLGDTPPSCPPLAASPPSCPPLAASNVLPNPRLEKISLLGQATFSSEGESDAHPSKLIPPILKGLLPPSPSPSGSNGSNRLEDFTPASGSNRLVGPILPVIPSQGFNSSQIEMDNGEADVSLPLPEPAENGATEDDTDTDEWNDDPELVDGN